jgi:hypothetical protein
MRGKSSRDCPTIEDQSEDGTVVARRWLAGQASGMSVVERLQDEERSGAPATFELEQILHLFKLACDDPAEYKRPIVSGRIESWQTNW